MKDTTTEDSFLRGLIDSDTACALYTLNGIRLEGWVVAHDDHCLFLRGAAERGTQTGITMLIMKAAISSIVPVSRHLKAVSDTAAPGAQLVP
jgi:sRNA-binding regulator protein Hfq